MRNLCSIVILHTQLWMHFAKTNRKTTKKRLYKPTMGDITVTTSNVYIDSVRRTDYFFLQPRETLLL